MGTGVTGFSALYDMAAGRLSTYDYFTWQAHVHALGATEIVFNVDGIKSTKWPAEEALKRFVNYIAPGPALSELPSRMGTDGNGDVGSYQAYDLAKVSFHRLKTVLPPEQERFTVTLRQTFHNSYKNSDEGVWREFAKVIGARVIEDHSVQPISLYQRMALYAGAEMNFGVPNGPVSMLTLTPYPVTIMCDPMMTAKGFGGHRIKIGEQVPYALPNQRLIWEKATDDSLTRVRRELGI